MRSRLLVLITAGLFALSACSGGDGKITIGAPSESTPSTVATDDAPADTEPTDTEATDDSTQPTDTTDTTDAAEPSDGTAAAPDMDKCIEVSNAFSSIASQAAGMTGSDAAAALDQMKAVLPEDLRDDIQTMVDGYSSPSSMGSQEFLDANTAITDYLTQICGAG